MPGAPQAKAGAGSATLSMAYAAARFADSCLRAMSGEGPVSEYAYIRHPPRLSSGSGSSGACVAGWVGAAEGWRAGWEQCRQGTDCRDSRTRPCGYGLRRTRPRRKQPDELT